MNIFNKLKLRAEKIQFSFVKGIPIDEQNFNNNVIKLNLFESILGFHKDTPEEATKLITKIERLGGKELFIELIKSNDFRAVRSAVFYDSRKTLDVFLNKAFENGGANLVKDLLSANNFESFQFITTIQKTSLCTLFLEKAHEAGGNELVRNMISGNGEVKNSISGYHGFRGYSGEIATLIYKNIEKSDSGFLKNFIEKCRFNSSLENEDETALNIYTQVSFPQELRASFIKDNVQKQSNNLTEIFKSHATIPDPNNLGRTGRENKYSKFLLGAKKLSLLKESLKDVEFDIGKVISNYSSDASKATDWPKIVEADRTLTYAKIKEIQDFIEAMNYCARYIVTDKFIREGQLGYLNSLNEESFNNIVKPIADRLFKESIESKTLVQLSKISNQWHSHRTALLKSKDNGLRHFAEEGAWYKITNESVINVTAPGLERYSIVNLINSQQLDEEGSALNHCASSYVDKCKKGYQVFSIKLDGESVSTVGFNIVNGRLELDQHYRHNNYTPEIEQKAVADWFMDQLKSGLIKLNLNQVGAGSYPQKYTELENKLGLELASITTECLQNNLNTITSLAKENIHDKKRNVYIFGRENVNADMQTIISNLGLADILESVMPNYKANLAPKPSVTQSHNPINTNIIPPEQSQNP